MAEPEGRKDLFYMLFERWPADKLDSLVTIYDFNCNAEEYELNREPLLFKYPYFIT